ncbi:hypothetical protein D6783_02695 [Candidatus Woesearchaeota archaeon]|nr:MAG: hypothetical protein D6783_02695 [Candidatus Woesearchaeota archaeon]
MVLETLTTAFKAENKPSKLILLGGLYAIVGTILSLWVFQGYASLVMVFLTAMPAIPLIYNIITMEEEKDLTGMEERWLLKEHGKALSAFIWLFIGMTIGFALLYVFLPSAKVATAYKIQGETINEINARAISIEELTKLPPSTTIAGGATVSVAKLKLNTLQKIFFNNLRVLIFCILFSFLFGSGAIFILTWNASVIGTAIGSSIRSELALAASLSGLDKLARYFTTFTSGLAMYAIHGLPEILSYFIGALAGGIISIAVIRHDFGTRKFEHIVLDAADLILLSIFVLAVAAVLEVYITPLIFTSSA